VVATIAIDVVKPSRAESFAAAERCVGARVRWRGESARGTVTAVRNHRGFPWLAIAWDPDAPEWWAVDISATVLGRSLELLPA
jgi:hypothetical protein